MPRRTPSTARVAPEGPNHCIIHVQNLCKRFGGKEVLRQIDLDVERGTTIVILGESGCGKSVLLKCITGLLEPDCGKVLYRGRDIAALSERERTEVRRHMGMLFQGSALFDSLTVAENVAFPIREHRRLPPGEVERIVAEKLELVGLPGTQAMMPAELSGGMKKRVALARAIAMDPEIVLYDEPTTGLDPIMADQINDLIVKTQRTLNVTSFVVTHDMDSATKVADRIVMLYQGRFVFDGTPEEILASRDGVVRSFVRGDARMREQVLRTAYVAKPPEHGNPLSGSGAAPVCEPLRGALRERAAADTSHGRED